MASASGSGANGSCRVPPALFYRVCNRLDGANGWLAAEELRATEARPAPDPATPTPPPIDPFRRFGGTS